jgi:hypothetical protein
MENFLLQVIRQAHTTQTLFSFSMAPIPQRLLVKPLAFRCRKLLGALQGKRFPMQEAELRVAANPVLQSHFA